MSHISEPDEIDEEDWFRDKLVYETEGVLNEGGLKYEILIASFGLDIGVFVFHGDRTKCKFMEVKTSTPRKGRVGIGDSRGEGTQIDLLQRDDDSLRRLDDVVMWVLGDPTRKVGEKRYAFFNCLEAKASAYGGIELTKQNNLNVGMLMKRALTWDELSNALKTFITS